MAKKNNSISPAAEELEQSVVKSVVESEEQQAFISGGNVYSVAWTERAIHEAYVYASSKLEAINKVLNREGDISYEVDHTPFNLTCNLIHAASDADASEYEDEPEVAEDAAEVDVDESEVAEDEKLYSLAWQEKRYYRETITASTKIHAINKAMLTVERPIDCSRPYAIACDEVGNDDNDDGFQDDGGYPDDYYTSNGFAVD